MNTFTKDELSKFTVPILKKIGEYYNLDTKGRKDVLIERILKYQKDGNKQENQGEIQMSVRVKRIQEVSDETR